MDWRTKVELYEQIRREYEFGVGSIIGVARKLGVHRRMVREAVRNAVPAQRKKTERPAVKMAPAVPLIDAILESDRKAPRKQRHTARRIFDRIRAEIPGCTPAERTVRQYVERRKHVLGLAEYETFVPQSYDWGVEAQVDGTRRTPIWMASASSYRSSRCVRWPAARPSIGRICRRRPLRNWHPADVDLLVRCRRQAMTEVSRRSTSSIAPGTSFGSRQIASQASRSASSLRKALPRRPVVVS